MIQFYKCGIKIREDKKIAQGHTAMKELDPNLNAGLLSLSMGLLT